MNQRIRDNVYASTSSALWSSWRVVTTLSGLLYLGSVFYFGPQTALTTHLLVKWGLLGFFSAYWWNHSTFMRTEMRKSVILMTLFLYGLFFIVGLEKGAVQFARDYTTELFTEWDRYPTFLPYLVGNIFTVASTGILAGVMAKLLGLAEKSWTRTGREEEALPGLKNPKN